MDSIYTLRYGYVGLHVHPYYLAYELVYCMGFLAIQVPEQEAIGNYFYAGNNDVGALPHSLSWALQSSIALTPWSSEQSKPCFGQNASPIYKLGAPSRRHVTLGPNVSTLGPEISPMYMLSALAHSTVQ